MWYGEIIAVDSEVHITLIDAIYNYYEELFNVKPAVRLEIITRFWRSLCSVAGNDNYSTPTIIFIERDLVYSELWSWAWFSQDS